MNNTNTNDKINLNGNAFLNKFLINQELSFSGLSTFAVVCTLDDNLNIIYSSDLCKNIIFSNQKDNESLSCFLSIREIDYLKYSINRNISECIYSFSLQLHLNINNGTLFVVHININANKSTVELLFFNCDYLKDDESGTDNFMSVISRNDFVYVEAYVKDIINFAFKFVSGNSCYYEIEPEFYENKQFYCNDLITKSSYERLKNLIVNSTKNHVTTNVEIIKPDKTIITVNCSIIINRDINKNAVYTNVFFFDINNDKNDKNNISIKEAELLYNLKKSKLVAEILKSLQVTDDYNDAIKIILDKVSSYASLSKIAFFDPDFSTGICNIFTYNKLSNKLICQEANIDELKKKYANIWNQLSTYGSAYYNSNGCSLNCETDFKTSCAKDAYLIYTVVLNLNKNCYIVCRDENSNRIWDNDIISLLSDISGVFAGLMHRFVISNELSIARNTLTTVLNNIDTCIYVSKISTNTIIYANKKFNDYFGYEVIGKHFWNVINIESTSILKKENTFSSSDKPRFYNIYCPDKKMWFDITEVNIVWHDGQTVRLTSMNNITEKITYEKRIENQANTDHLTGLPNRRRLELDFPKMLKDAENADSFGYIFFLDLDNFKNVNDGLGHPYGDALLKNISDFLLSQKYICDTCYRFGGDEFIIIVDHKYNDKVDNILDSLTIKFQHKWEILDKQYFCTSSIGVAKFPYDGYTLVDILKKVDMAMYSSKKLGKNRITYYKSKIGKESIRNIELERYLKESILNGFKGFSVYYQPIINTHTKKIIGSEALLRWSGDNFGNISPSEFIPMAENLGLIIPLGEYVLIKAVKKCKAIIDNGMPDFQMNINLSAIQILDKDIVKNIKSIISKENVPYSNISLEITEGIALKDTVIIKNILHELHELGIKISLDDFGTGYSSLNYIKKLPLNTIKIDKSFIDDLEKNDNTELFIKTIVALAHGLNMKVCAEGVETSNQYKMLIDLKTDVIQGFYFGKPMPDADFTDILKKQQEG